MYGRDVQFRSVTKWLFILGTHFLQVQYIHHQVRLSYCNNLSDTLNLQCSFVQHISLTSLTLSYNQIFHTHLLFQIPNCRSPCTEKNKWGISLVTLQILHKLLSPLPHLFS